MYPVMLDIRCFKVLIIGGGKIGTRKTNGILEAGGSATVIAPHVSDTIQQLAVDDKIILKRRAFAAGDTRGFDLIFLCTDDPLVHRAAEKEVGPHQLINDTMKKASSNFYNMGVLTENEVVLAVSTLGKSPAYTKKVLEKLKKSAADLLQ
ncbi:bifunctional precorrin-2 dehydrogenase/sirohydrochlorin ferrochelatase [Enterococcus hirae]|nr:bifunctional precorrin-2 dehydrogenase/sirohydrochlorin ferrochelatase [Enterococcus hirae]